MAVPADVVDLEQVAAKAREFFGSGWNCAESVLQAACFGLDQLAAKGLLKERGIPWPPDRVPVELATCFGGGIGSSRSTCGALTGAILAIGLVAGRRCPDADARQRAYALARRMYERFRSEFHTTQCWEITACEQDRERRHEICTPLVGRTAQMVLEVLYDWLAE